MIDFQKANTSVSKEEYLWEWSLPQVKLASFDFSHVVYLSDKEMDKKNATVINSAEDLKNSFKMFQNN